MLSLERSAVIKKSFSVLEATLICKDLEFWLWQFMLPSKRQDWHKGCLWYPKPLVEKTKGQTERLRLVLEYLTKLLRLCMGHQQTRCTEHGLKLVEIIWHFKKSSQEFIIDSIGNFWTSLHSCFCLELHIDGGRVCVTVVFLVLYLYALVHHSEDQGDWSHELWGTSGGDVWIPSLGSDFPSSIFMIQSWS